MTPAVNVMQCYPSDTIETALDLILANPEKGAVIVLHEHGDKHIPVGIVTKTDLLHALKEKLSLTSKVETIMGHEMETIFDTASKDQAAEHFEKTKHYNAIVVNKDKQWVGLLTVLDTAMDRARDGRAWPWNRDEGVLDYFARQAHSPRSKRNVAAIPKHPDEEPTLLPPSFLGIAGAAE